MKANYLLNFSFSHNPQTETSKRKKPAYVPHFDKNVFMNANFQWVLKDDRDCKLLLSNPDAIVDWTQVVIVISSIPNCPICLEEPKIPKCTKCGHIYCWTCILQYLQTNHKCPICYQYVSAEELKTLVGRKDSNYDSKQLKMKLLKRSNFSSRLALKEGSLYMEELPHFEDQDILPFSRHLSVKQETLNQLLQQDMDALLSMMYAFNMERESWMEIQGHLPRGLSNDLPFIEIAIDKLKKNMELIKIEKCTVNHSRKMILPDYFFFMDANGCHAYLSPLDIKILKHEFSSYSEFPAEIQIWILNIVDLRLDEKLIDVDWDKTSLVKQETLNHFSRELSDRHRRISRIGKKDKCVQMTHETANITDIPVSQTPHLSTDDFPQVLIKPSSLDSEYHGPSFASMTKKAASVSVSSPVRKSPNRLIFDENENELQDSAGWTLDLEEMILAEENSEKSIGSKKKSSKKISLLSNGGSRRRT